MVKSFPGGSMAELTAVGNTLYFMANDGTNGVELWKSDGTASGTLMVKDINVGGSGFHWAHGGSLTAVGNTLFFHADDGIHGIELWKSDGTASGTVMVKDINNGSYDSIGTGSVTNFTAIGNTLYFQANDGYTIHGNELWKSDGTASGTVMVKDIRSGPAASNPSHLTMVGSTLFFSANDGTSTKLWKSDGTTSGTSYTILFQIISQH